MIRWALFPLVRIGTPSGGHRFANTRVFGGGLVLSGPILPGSPLDDTRQATATGISVCDPVLPQGDLAALLEVARALGVASRRTWTVAGLLETLRDWFLARSDEARRLHHGLRSHAVERCRLKREFTSLREASERRAGAYERALHDRDRYRREWDSLPSSLPASVPEDGAPRRIRAPPAVRDP